MTHYYRALATLDQLRIERDQLKSNNDSLKSDCESLLDTIDLLTGILETIEKTLGGDIYSEESTMRGVDSMPIAWHNYNNGESVPMLGSIRWCHRKSEK